MIYFIQRDTDDCIAIGQAINLQEVYIQLQSQFGNVRILGVQPDDEIEILALYERFQHLRHENDANWFMESTELLDYIDETATSYEDRSIDPAALYKSSEYTPIKQQSLFYALNQQINLVVHITDKWERVRPYLYFDLNAGPGMSQDNQPGSPVIFRRVASVYAQNWRKFSFEARLYEADLQTYSKLVQHIGADRRFTVIPDSHNALAAELDKRAELPENERKWVYGAIYADPSNADLPWALLEQADKIYPRVDVMINIACASYKRTIATAGYQTLAERLPRIKKQWLVRKPYGKHQWSILIGTNWLDYPPWEKKEFFRWNDNGIGQDIFDKLVLTPKQRRKRDQLSFLDDE